METEIGFIPDDWEIKRLSALDPRRDAIKTGPFGSLLHSYDYSDEGRPLLLVNNINGGKLVDTEYPLVNFKKADELKQFWLEEGDIVYTRVGEVGRTLYVSKEFEGWMFSGQTLRIRIRNKEVNNRFVELFLRTPIHKKIASQTALGSTRESINTSILSDTIIPLPKRNEQDEIVKTIYCFDQKIDLLRRQNQTLENIVQAIFKHWFVDFEFPDENRKPYKSSGGKVVPSEEFGEIPEGWRVGRLSEIAEITTGKGLKMDEYHEEGAYPVLGANGEMGKTDDYLYDQRLIITGRVGTLGNVNIVNEKAWISDNVLITLPKDNLFYFTYFIMKRINYKSLNRGSTQPLITQTDLKNTELIIPRDALVEEFEIIANSCFSKINNNTGQINDLTKTRGILLPKLMSGQIRVTV